MYNGIKACSHVSRCCKEETITCMDQGGLGEDGKGKTKKD
jgi:hypothetical protein